MPTLSIAKFFVYLFPYHWWYLIVVLICILLTANVFKHLSGVYLASLYPPGKVYVHVFWPFLKWGCFLTVQFWEVFIILDTCLLLEVIFANIFFLIWTLSFISLVFHRTKVSNYYIIFTGCAFSFIFKNSLTKSVMKIFFCFLHKLLQYYILHLDLW